MTATLSADVVVITYDPRTSSTVVEVNGAVSFAGPEPLGREGACITAAMLASLGRTNITVRRLRGSERAR